MLYECTRNHCLTYGYCVFMIQFFQYMYMYIEVVLLKHEITHIGTIKKMETTKFQCD